jgi:hypothetical protein
MKPVLIAGTVIVNLALISYTLFIRSERKTKKCGNRVLAFLTAGVVLDATATVCMILGSTSSPFTLHGILGYTALGGMLADTAILWRNRINTGADSDLPSRAHIYSLIAYCWWIAAYITGILLIALK